LTNQFKRKGKEEFLEIINTIIKNGKTVAFKAKAESGWPIEYISENISLFGYSAEEMTAFGKKLSEIIHPDDIERIEKESEKFLSLGDKISNIHEYRIIRKDGGISWVREENQPIYDQNNNLVSFVGIIADEDERITAQLELQKLNQRLKITLKQTIEILAETAGRRDPYTASHQKRVAKLAFDIGKKINLDDNTLEGLYLAAIVHDVGKIAVPAEILSKPTALNDLEFSMIKKHSESGYEILSKLDTFWPLAEIVWQHHERLDGSGYPKGLKGKEILKEAKIIAVADVVEAINSHRPYRAGYGIETALEVIQEGRGTKFDSESVDACIELFEEEGFSFEEE
jgi:PAS domain S-box-containing protein